MLSTIDSKPWFHHSVVSTEPTYVVQVKGPLASSPLIDMTGPASVPPSAPAVALAEPPAPAVPGLPASPPPPAPLVPGTPAEPVAPPVEDVVPAAPLTPALPMAPALAPAAPVLPRGELPPFEHAAIAETIASERTSLEKRRAISRIL